MISVSIVDLYYDWLTDLVCSKSKKPEYRKLLAFLHSTEFTYILPMDKNRYEDGISLRWRFSSALSLNHHEVKEELDEPCSVLEMMIALSIRCEEEIMGGNIAYENRTSAWFWSMIDSLGLTYMKNDLFDLDDAKLIIFRFLNRDYEHTGKGGLFTIPWKSNDLRNVEIWTQLNWYVSSIS